MRIRSAFASVSIALLSVSAIAGLIPLASVASADEVENSFLRDFEVHGFLSQGYIKSTDNNYLGYSKLGTFDFTESGLNLTKQLADNLQTGLQLATERVGPTGSFNVQLDWFYLDYQATDQFGIRLGRVKLPFGLYNDSRDIDAARVPILLPQSIYPEQSQQYLLAENGFEIHGYNQFNLGGALDYRFYGGTIFVDTSTTPQIQSLNVPYLAGGRVMWETPLDGLRFGMSAQALRLDFTELLGSSQVTGEVSAILWVTSLEYAHEDLLLAAELCRTYASSGDSNYPAIFPAASTIGQAAYVMGTYRLNPWLGTALYYSVLFPQVDMMSGQENEQKDISATLRFDLNRFWLVKVEGHYMIGTAGLSSALNDGNPLSSLDGHWGVFLLKTTAYF